MLPIDPGNVQGQALSQMTAITIREVSIKEPLLNFLAAIGGKTKSLFHGFTLRNLFCVKATVTQRRSQIISLTMIETDIYGQSSIKTMK